MITKRFIYWSLNTALMAGALGSLSYGLYFQDVSLFIGVWIFALLLFPAAFIMDLLHLNIADPILRLAGRFGRRKN